MGKCQKYVQAQIKGNGVKNLTSFSLSSSVRRLTFAALLSLSLVACAPSRPPVPPGTIPKPKPLNQAETEYGRKVLGALTQKYKVDNNHPRYQNVLDIVDRLHAKLDPQSDPWQVYVLKGDDVKNAAATRGNHVFVWTGMIDATKSDEELAAVIGHEMGHVLARHTDPDPNEAIRKVLIGVGAMAAGVAVAGATNNASLGQNAGQLTQQISQQVGNAIAVYPYSRTRELEADHIGLFLMADAGYNPEAALSFWKRAQSDPAFSSSLEFFSTHPPAGTRLEKLKALMPQADMRFRGLRASTGGSMVDSWDISEGAGGEQVGDSRQSWQVVSSRAVLYSGPSVTSQKIGEFRRGSILESSGGGTDWVEIQTPDRGFLRAEDLVPLAE